MEPAEETLIRARAGDHAAFAELVREHEAMVFGLACHFFRDRALAEELAQDVFVRLYQGLSAIESPQHLTFWLRRVTSNRCIDYFRREAQRQKFLAAEGTFNGGPYASRSLTPAPSRDVLLEETVRRLVSALPPKPRLVITLRYQEDLEPAEIADVLDMPVNTVKSHLRRSLSVLRARLDQHVGSRP